MQMEWTFSVSLLFIYQGLLRAVCVVRWPDGDYALPMSIYGCPEPGRGDWNYGYMNISFSQRADLYERHLGLVGWNQSFLMLVGPYGPYSYQLNFCTKSSGAGNSSDPDIARWPSGHYSIYGTNNGCPIGFTTNNHSLDLPEIEHINKDGHLPEIEIHEAGDRTEIVFMLCQKEVNGTTETTQIVMASPYIVFIDQEQENLENASGADLYHEELYFLSRDGKGNDKLYNWLNYSVIVPRLEEEEGDCFEDPFLYAGYVNTTVSGFACESWAMYSGERTWMKDDNFPEGSIQEAQNFCRSPDNMGYSPWCYTTEPDKLWEYCGIPSCSGQCLDYQSDCATLDPQANFCSSKSDKCKKLCNACAKQKVNMECYRNPLYYAGNVSTTTTGHACQPWTNFIGQKSYILDYNFPDETVASAGRFCRSPDRGGFPPWCFSTNPDEDWEYCGVSKCEENCVDDSDDCSIIASARKQFCVENGDKCPKTCDRCNIGEDMFSLVLPTSDKYFKSSCMRNSFRSKNITKEQAVPELLLSENNWSFRSGGAMHCQQYIEFHDPTIDIICRNSPALSGRYLVLIFQTTSDSHPLEVLSEQWQITIHSKEESNRCSQTLGMGTRVIEDFQISASSEHHKYPATGARPYDSGWCTDSKDTSPYIQIDLLRPLTVEGIQIFNWEESVRLTNASRYIPFIKGMGVYNFLVNYRNIGSELDEFSYKQAFYVDRHMTFEAGQTFLFSSPVTTDVIRIQLLSAIDINGMLCLRMELIGCQILDSAGARCTTTADNHWFASERLFVSPYRRHTQGPFVTGSSKACQLKCEENFDTCNAALFNSHRQMCQIFEAPDTYSYYQLLVENEEDEGFIKICKTYNSKDIQRSSLYLSNDSRWRRISRTVTRPGYLISHGYPYHYTSGVMWLWEIAFDNAFVGLLFSNMSFNVYKLDNSRYMGYSVRTESATYAAQTAMPSQQIHALPRTSVVKGDTILDQRYLNPTFLAKRDRLYILKSSFDANDIFTKPYIFDFVSEIIDILDSRNNDKRAQYRTNERRLRLLLRTHANDAPVLAFGNGFRALAFALDTVTCVPWEVCSWPMSVLGSGTVLGSQEHILFEMWEIVGDGYEHIVVDFVRFYVACDGSSEFAMDYGGNSKKKYCNMDMPRKVTTVYSNFQIDYQLYRYAGHLLEGFIANYYISSADARMNSADYSLHNDSVTNLGHETDMETFSGRNLYKVFSVCSEHFNKCYVLIRLTGSEVDINWNQWYENICALNNLSSLSVHSKEEQQFIGHFLQNNIQDRRKMVQEFLYIGLHRKLLPTRKYIYRWNDGTPVTFTAWTKDQPSTNRNKNCARMDVTSLTDDFSWDLISCEQPGAAQYGACQYTSTDRNTTVHHMEYDILNMTHPHEYRDKWTSFQDLEKSIFFFCDNGIISFVGVCDGNADCLDGGDERNCKGSVGSCSPTEYKCADGRCISVSLLCDYHDDCVKGEDENCYFPSCEATEFRCNNSQCIDIELRCDAKIDCSDASDEGNCVRTDCNNGTSFLCLDRKCIPNTQVCDGVWDCDAGDDEKDCLFPNTCQEWWNAGYTSSGQFKVHGVDMECDFDQVYTNRIILTKYFGIEIRRNVMTHMSYRYKDKSIIEKLHEESRCYQSMNQFCQPWFKLLYESDTNQTQEKHNRCQCVKYVHWFSQNDTTIEDCDDGAILDPDSVFHLTFSKTKPEYLLGGAKSEQFNIEILMIQINPIVCLSDVTLEEQDIACGYGISAPAETRCLYDLDEFQTIIGCRSLAHLQNCASFKCPVGFVKCHQSFCLESRFICDGVKQCQYGDDEQNCETRICPSQYRCLQSSICLAQKFICDGFRHCPLGDDERLCNFRCPDECTCYGLAIDCTQSIITNISVVSFTPNTRQIDASRNTELIPHLYPFRRDFVYLARLNMSVCSISSIESDFFLYMKNLLSLDISYNRLNKIQSHLFVGLKRLETLYINGNSEMLTIESYAFSGLNAINDFVMSDVFISVFKIFSFHGLKLKSIDLSDNIVDIAEDGIFAELKVDTVYLNGTTIKTFQKDMFVGIEKVNTIISNAYKFCCIRPSYVPEQNCYPHQDEFSSCADLMRNDVLRPLIWIIGFFALIGNVLSLIYRFMYDKSRLRLGYGIFVTNLAFADFLMGVYMITIASADVFYRGRYIFFDEIWRNSFWCKMAGMLSTVASEGSVLFLCAITLDRLFVIKYPFGEVRFTPKLAGITCCAIWAIALLVAILPLVVSSYFHDDFYSKSGVCLALPLTRDRPPGWVYSISIFIVFNSAAFLLIAIGQWSIYREIDASRIFKSAVKSKSLRRFVFGNRKMSTKASTGRRTRRNNDLRVSRNLLLVVTTDFMCWCPIGILGILALTDHVIPGDVYAWIAVVVLPINSALNPFLYTFSAIFGKKKFVPDTLEQSRNEMSSVELQQLLRLWRNKWFFRARQKTDKLVKLHRYAVEEGLSIKECVQIATGLTKRLRFLHERNLIQSDLDFKDIYIQKEVSGCVYVYLDLRPILVQKQTEKSANIDHLGGIISALLLRRKKQVRQTYRL